MKARNTYELNLMRKSGVIAAKALEASMNGIKIGVSGLDIDKIAAKTIYDNGGDLSYKTVPGYKYATCITINEGVVHGLPNAQKFVNGDLVSVDLAVMYKGWHTDCAWSLLIGKDAEKEKFLKTGELALRDAVKQAIEGNRVGDISNAIQTRIEGAGYSVVRSLVGHGVGRSLHEDPEIPGYGSKNSGSILKAGMTLAIEVIYAAGAPDVEIGEDKWTFSTVDKSWGGLFEMTVIVGKKEPEVLTDWHEI